MTCVKIKIANRTPREKRVRNGKKKRVLCFYVFYVKMKTMIIG